MRRAPLAHVVAAPGFKVTSRQPAVLALIVSTTIACGGARRPPPVVAVPPSPPAAAPETPAALSPALTALRQELEHIFANPIVDHALWGVEVRSLDSGELIFSLNPGKLMMPASNMKIVTLAAAAERLGWDFQYETQLLTAAPVVDGVLQGDVIVRGSGDPTIGADAETALEIFETWAAALRAEGIRRVAGRLVGDDDAFVDEPLGAGWAWDYLAYGYAAPTGALQFRRNMSVLTLTPGPRSGEPVALEIEPATNGLTLVNEVATGPADAEVDLNLLRLPGQSTLLVSGVLPAGGGPFRRTISVDNPTQFFVDALEAVLAANGIAVDGGAHDIDDTGGRPASRLRQGFGAAAPERDARRRAAGPPDVPLRVLASHTSPPLSEMGTVLMKVSQNQYAESLLKTLGGGRVPGTAAAGRRAVEAVLTSWGMAPGQYQIYDGSGLSRYNYLTAEMLVTILRQMYRDPRHREPFMATLPIAGVDGTIGGRLEGTRAEDNARAKTGTISNVRALSGYVETADDEPLAFSIIANHFTVPSSVIDRIVDLAVERLANFSRR